MQQGWHQVSQDQCSIDIHTSDIFRVLYVVSEPNTRLTEVLLGNASNNHQLKTPEIAQETSQLCQLEE